MKCKVVVLKKEVIKEKVIYIKFSCILTVLTFVSTVSHATDALSGYTQEEGVYYTDTISVDKSNSTDLKKITDLKSAVNDQVIDTLSGDTIKKETLLSDTLEIDLLTIDSLKSDTTVIDTMSVIGGILPIIEEQRLERHFYTPIDTLDKKKVKVKRPFSELAMQRSPLFKKDTISVKKLAMISVVVPGFGQLYNKEYAKIPILYGGVGALAAGAIITSQKYNDAKKVYNAGVANNLPEHELYASHGKMTKYNNYRTVFIAGAAFTYMYFLADGISNYKGDVHPTNKATLLSALFPGAGQIYNNKYWKLPIIYGGFATFAFIINYNGRGYTRYNTAYKLLTDGDDSTIDEFNGTIDADRLQNTRDSFRRYRDLGIIMTAGFYILQIIDAHVDAYLNRYDVSNDLAMDIAPVMIQAPGAVSNPISNGAIGMGIKLKF